MKYIGHLSLALGIICCFSCGGLQEKASEETMDIDAQDSVSFQAIIDSIFRTYPATKGVMMHVESPDLDISWNGAVGMADSTTNRRLEPHFPALIASNTKTYVAATMLRLVEMKHITLDQSIKGLISERSDSVLSSDGYDLESITVAHLMSHTSGMFDYCDSELFLSYTTENPSYEWTRDEQIELSATGGDPLGPPGSLFSYADLNYLLLTEIIELKTSQPFYTAMRELLHYETLGLNHTWFNILEPVPTDMPPLIHQYATSKGVDSYTMHGSFDLYGGGGIATTTTDLALFSQNLFEARFFDSPETLNLIYTDIETGDSIPSNYYMGLAEMDIAGMAAYGHGGFWGTTVQYIPELNTSIAVFVLDRDEWQRYRLVLDEVAKYLVKRRESLTNPHTAEA